LVHFLWRFIEQAGLSGRSLLLPAFQRNPLFDSRYPISIGALMDSTRYYKSTGQAPFGAVVSASQFGIFAAIICGALYGIIVCYNPIIYINFLGALVVPLAVGAALKMRFHSGKIRSESVKFWTGGFCGVLAVYCAWWGWLVAFYKWDFIFLNPVDLPSIITDLDETSQVVGREAGSFRFQ